MVKLSLELQDSNREISLVKFAQVVIYMVNVSLNGVIKRFCQCYWTGEISPVFVRTIPDVLGESFH